MTGAPDLFAVLHPFSSVTAEMIERAGALRDDGLSYTAIAVVMGRYHDAWFSPHTWRHYLRAVGHAPKGAGFTSKSKAPAPLATAGGVDNGKEPR